MVNGEARPQQQMIGSLTPQQHQQLQEQVGSFLCGAIEAAVRFFYAIRFLKLFAMCFFLSVLTQMAHHQALSQHQAVQSSSHQDVHQNRALSGSGSGSGAGKNDDHCKDQSQIDGTVKDERMNTDAHNSREKSVATETRLPVISMTG